MDKIDLIIFVVYLLGLLGVVSIFARLKDTKEMFAAGGQSPWWLSGLSSFMTTFSAGTFVIWGGIAYQYGLVGISILFVIGIAAILVGWFLASHWKNLGYDSAAEYLDDRFGRSLVQFYTWLHGFFILFTMGGAVYALAVIVTALIPLPEGHLLVDPETGNFSVSIASLIIMVVVILITLTGGLWAVLITDALQFIILMTSVVFVVPLLLIHVGGFSEFLGSVPEGFLSPVASEFNWWFLTGWCLVFFFKMGGEWAYIQRSACVTSGKDASKSFYLFGILYIVSPFIWMLPPMIYRIIDPGADYEQAYILAVEVVLPSGMLGLMIAAMCSATASMVTTQLNVYAGAFTTEFYKRLFRPDAPARELVNAGRVFTLLLGGVAIAGALLIPYVGTYTGYILSSMSIMTGPLVLPTIWGLFSKKIGLKTAWSVSVLGITLGLLVKLTVQLGWIDNIDLLAGFLGLLQANERITDIVMGALFPLMLLVIAETYLKNKSTDPGWQRIIVNQNKHEKKTKAVPSPLPGIICGWATCVVALLMGILAFIEQQEKWILAGFALLLIILGGGILMVAYRIRRIKDKDAENS